MSPVRMLAITLGLTLGTLFAASGLATAQTGGPNPTGGTWCRPTTGDAGTVSTSAIASGFSFDLLLRNWVATLVARPAIQVESAAATGSARAVTTRRLRR